MPSLSKKSSTLLSPLVIELRPSRRLALLQIGATLLALAAVARSGLALPSQLLIAALLLLILAMSMRGQGWLGGRVHCHAIRWDGGRWLWRTPDGRRLTLRLQRAVVWRALIVMRFTGPGGSHSLCLLPDSADADALRRLRLCLRYLPVYEGPPTEASRASPQ